MKIDREDLAWPAGLFEGEGSFSIANRKRYRGIVAELGMTDEDRVRGFHRIVGVGNVTVHPKKILDKKGVPHKTVYVWKTASFEGVQLVIALLWKWLGLRRKNRAAEILSDYHKNEFGTRRFALALPDEVSFTKKLLSEGVSKRTVARLVGRSYGFVNHIKQGRTHGEAA